MTLAPSHESSRTTPARRLKGLRPRRLVEALWAAPLLVALGVAGPADAKQVILIHTGDIHGHLVPRPNLRSDSTGRLEGGVARIATVIEQIRRAHARKTLYVNTGDTLQGSAEALFTRGQAMIDVLNLLKPDFHAPGNWDYLYGPQRFLQTFVGTDTAPPLAPWNALAANLYYGDKHPKAGQRVLPPYKVVTVNGVRIGVLGMTTKRAIAIVGPGATADFKFTSGETELPQFIDILRNQEKVDLIVMIAELELAHSIAITERHPGVDVVLSADMHEETRKPIVNRSGTILVEEGQDGTMVGELRLNVIGGKLRNWAWKPHLITDKIRENPQVAAKIAAVRAPFLTGSFVPGQKVSVGGNEAELLRPVDEIVGYTAVGLHRSNFSNEALPAVIEGTSHDFLVDAFRWAADSDFATLRGFRYGTHIAPGPITMNDLYHYMPIAARIARVSPVYGKQLKDQVENSSRGVFDPDSELWTGGWMFGYSNVSFDLDVYAPYGSRGSNIRVGGVPIDPTDTSQKAYSVAGYWYADDPNTINNCGNCGGPGASVEVVTGEDGKPLDATEVVVQYLQSLPGMTANPTTGRIKLLKPLPAPKFGNPEIQPLRGAIP